MKLKRLVVLTIVSLLITVISAQAYDSSLSASWSSALYLYAPAAVQQIEAKYTDASGNNAYGTTSALAAHTSIVQLVGNVSTLGPTGTPPKYFGSLPLATSQPVAAVHADYVTPGWNTVESDSQRKNDHPMMLYTAQELPSQNTLFFPHFVYDYDGGRTYVVVQDGKNLAGWSAYVRIRAYTANAAPTVDVTRTLAVGGRTGFYGSDLGLSTGWQGSLRIDAVKQSDSATPVPITAVARTLATSARWAYAYEGQPVTSTGAWVPARCGSGYNTIIHIQNVGDTFASHIAAIWYASNGDWVGYWSPGQDGLYSGTSTTLDTCALTDGTTFNGTVRTFFDQLSCMLPEGCGGTPPPTTYAVVLGITHHTEGSRAAIGGFSTWAYGARKQWALPLVRWADAAPGWKTDIQIINPAYATIPIITATYYEGDGDEAGTHTFTNVPGFSSKFTSPYTANVLDDGVFGYYPPTGPGGAVEIEADAPVLVFATVYRDSATGNLLSESYSGVPLD